MKKLTLFFVFISLSLFYCANSFADGGGPEPPMGGCATIPSPNYDGPLIQGTFTAAFDKSQHSINTTTDRHYNIHVCLEGTKLENGREIPIKMLYSFSVPISSAMSNTNTLCDYQLYHFMNKFQYTACNREVTQVFGFSKQYYYPVITDIWVNHKENCNNYKEAMISGTIKLRITPK
jgi:hypothetical protein